MNFSIAFKGLPFEPEKRQVIFAENQYDERINALIRDNYDQLKWMFKRTNLDFVYLPMFFNDEETKEKVLYYAPYLTSEILEKAELRSSYLLGYMSHQENREKIAASLLYSPKKDDEEWIFQGLTIDIEGEDGVQWASGIIEAIEEELDADEKSERNSVFYADKEDDNERLLFRDGDDMDFCSSKPEYSSVPNLGDKLKKWKIYSKSCLDVEEPTTSSLDEMREEDVRYTIEELERNIERLRLLGIPLTAIVEFVAKYETVSRLRLTDDLRIFLPDYNNIEVKMPAKYKAVYFLFLNHPEGIVLQQLEDFHQELVNYYLQTSGKREMTPHMIETVNNLEYPGNNSINIALSKIKTCFKAVIDEHLAKNYFVVGRPGEPYKLVLDNHLIEWEEEE